MSMNLKEMFHEKNQDLFFNKLILDLENNTDTFKLTSKNIVKIEIAKLLSSLRRIYSKYSMVVNDDELKSILGKNKKELLRTIELLIDKKNDDNKEYIKTNKEPTNKQYIKSYGKHINSTEEKFEQDLKVAVLKNADVLLCQQILRMQSCCNEQAHEEIFKVINLDFCGNLIDRIIDESLHRNRTLKNISEETYKWYLNLNKTSKSIENSSLQKVLKNNQ